MVDNLIDITTWHYHRHWNINPTLSCVFWCKYSISLVKKDFKGCCFHVKFFFSPYDSCIWCNWCCCCCLVIDVGCGSGIVINIIGWYHWYLHWFLFFKFLQKACFYFLKRHKITTHTGRYNTQQMRLYVQNWRIMDYETKILNAIHYVLSTSDKIFNITLKCE